MAVDDIYNWHFLFHQQTHWLAIHTREGHKDKYTSPAFRVDLKDPNAASIIADKIRSYGSLAKERLQAKWETACVTTQLDLPKVDLVGCVGGVAW